MEIIQWMITVIVAVVTFIGGRRFERQKVEQENRIKLLEPIEQWIERVSKIKGMIGDELTAINLGLPLPVGYSMSERIETIKYLGDNRDKIIGILKSKALSTSATKKVASNLADLIVRIDSSIRISYIPTYSQLIEKKNIGRNILGETEMLLTITEKIQEEIQDIHSCIAILKTKYN